MPRVFLYHRFTSPDKKIAGRVRSDIFGWQLDQMQKHGVIMSLAKCIEFYQNEGRWPKKTFVITVDDGYRDFYKYAFPELKKRKLNATFFPTVNFVDRLIWLWPDRLDAALRTKTAFDMSITAHGGMQKIHWNTKDERALAWKTLSDLCIVLPDNLRQNVIREIEQKIGVNLPETPTQEYEACTWEELDELSNAGIEVGSHTMNHPILSKIPKVKLEEEILISKKHLENRLHKPVKTFCYPNSKIGDVNEDVVNAVKSANYIGAVFEFDQKSWNSQYLIPRIGVDENQMEFLWKISGGEVLYMALTNYHQNTKKKN